MLGKLPFQNTNIGSRPHPPIIQRPLDKIASPGETSIRNNAPNFSALAEAGTASKLLVNTRETCMKKILDHARTSTAQNGAVHLTQPLQRERPVKGALQSVTGRSNRTGVFIRVIKRHGNFSQGKRLPDKVIGPNAKVNQRQGR